MVVRVWEAYRRSGHDADDPARALPRRARRLGRRPPGNQTRRVHLVDRHCRSWDPQGARKSSGMDRSGRTGPRTGWGQRSSTFWAPARLRSGAMASTGVRTSGPSVVRYGPEGDRRMVAGAGAVTDDFLPLLRPVRQIAKTKPARLHVVPVPAVLRHPGRGNRPTGGRNRLARRAARCWSATSTSRRRILPWRCTRRERPAALETCVVRSSSTGVQVTPANDWGTSDGPTP